MKLIELENLLANYADRYFRISLPDGSPVPVSFHVTEIGHVVKTFLDCGGKRRETTTVQLQIWVGSDYDHRIETSKMSAILNKAKPFLRDRELPVEVEYEDQVISQYTIEGFSLTDDAVVLELAHKHTACLAPDLCGVSPSSEAKADEVAGAGCCGSTGCW